jgi:phosphoribosylaminoimidazolecarboxamide formyltransferase/IMP cyclohydrolase
MNNLELLRELSSGINEHQTAKLYTSEKMLDYTSYFELSFLDIQALTLALSVASEFYDVSAVVSADYSHVFGVALAPTLVEGYSKVMDANPIDIQNSVIAVTQLVDSEFARMLTKGNLLVAPEYSEEAKKILDKKDIKFITLNTPLVEFKNFIPENIVATPFGTIFESPNKSELNKDTFKVESITKPTVEQIEDAVFAWKISKYVKSRGVVISKGFKTTAIIQGVQNSALELALDYSCDTSKDAIIAVDGMITPYDINVIAQGRISAVILPQVTKEIVELANKYNIVLISTGFTNHKY